MPLGLGIWMALPDKRLRTRAPLLSSVEKSSARPDFVSSILYGRSSYLECSRFEGEETPYRGRPVWFIGGSGLMGERSDGVFARDEANPPHSAPGLIGPGNILDWASRVPSKGHRRPFRHLRLEIDLAGGRTVEVPFPHLEVLRNVLHARRIVESEDLLTLIGQTLSAMTTIGLRKVHSWELLPSGILPNPPEGDHLGGAAIGTILRTIHEDALEEVRSATGFHAHLRGDDGNAAEIVLNRDHSRKVHALSLDLNGSITREQLRHLLTRLSQHLSIARAEVTKFATDSARPL